MRPSAGVPARAVARVSVELTAIRFLLVSAVVFLFGLVQAMGRHANIVELLGQDKVDHVMVMEQGSTDLYKMVKKMNSEKGVPEHMMKAWAHGICTGVNVFF
jgi:hypothetical protein